MVHPSGNAAATIYERSLALGREAIDVGLFEVAFHSISAALHCAEHLEDLARAKSIEDLVDETQRRIDREHPDHRIGSRASTDRGHRPLFKTLGLHAQSVAARIRGVDAVAGANRVSGIEKNRGGHTSDKRRPEDDGTSAT